MTPATRVRAGSLFLDSRVPAWWTAVDPDRLDVACVLEQQFGGVSGGLIAYELTKWQAVQFGFLTQTGYSRKEGMTPEERAAYVCRFEVEEAAINAAWADEIELRRRLGSEIEARDHWLSRINRHLPQGEWLDESDLAPVGGEEVGL